MKIISLAACLLFICFSCRRSIKTDLMNGLWKIRKVEIWKDNEVEKIIDTGNQFWSFGNSSQIEIFDTHKIQNILHVKMGAGSIRSYDSGGALKDEFIIQQLNEGIFALSSKQKVLDDEYNIIYYLCKVKDSTAEEIQRAF